ncbi:TetR/AcrR family transcriptional regulator [Nocardioides anomalus]|uniref:TetR/AcrR family transcriptional regulator n=1 Tax=Nocardioides anomalus TaxID=2712223 RepID=A0A6G6W8R5_9ACTN|nr:TetR/AcrR family transcriptional regulator [Nocardioides anomalus]QIG41741.1 TetR/AcrR family transcriptional regulator [Nocardioides anomalus]
MPRTSRAEQADATRARIRDAALAAFAERGFHGTSTREIATACGLSPAALYVHYASKEQVLHEISLAGHREVLGRVRESVAGHDDARQRLRALVSAYVAFHAERATLARVINYELAALAEDHRLEVEAVRRDIDEVLRAGLAPFTAVDTRTAAVALESLGIDIARWYRPGGRWTPQTLAASYVDLAVRMVGA